MTETPRHTERPHTPVPNHGLYKLLGIAPVVVTIFVAGMVTERSLANPPQATSTGASGIEFVRESAASPGFADALFVDLLIEETNAIRQAEGLAPLVSSEILNDSAGYKLDHMVRRSYWAHQSPDGRSPWFFLDAAEYAYAIAGENLARGFRTPNDVVTGWKASDSHRANLLAPGYTEIGVAVRFLEQGFLDGVPGWVVVAHYARPR